MVHGIKHNALFTSHALCVQLVVICTGANKGYRTIHIIIISFISTGHKNVFVKTWVARKRSCQKLLSINFLIQALQT
jgi:hypothetical protein